MKNIKIFQIIYNEATKESMDPGFLPLDNMDNSRSDWREYWPIRNYLLNNLLNESGLYGFFSPKFKFKTGLSANDCFNFINSQPDEIDVFGFSPFYDLGAFFQNSFYQAIAQHPESEYAMVEGLKIVDPTIDINSFVMNSGE